MPKVVSTVTSQRFEKFGVAFPVGWDIVFLSPPYTEAELSAACQGADYLLADSAYPVTERVISENQQLKLIHAEGVAYDKINVTAAAAYGIPVCNNRAVNNGAVAEHAIGLMLAGLRRITQCSEEIPRIGFAASQKAHRAQGEHELSAQHIGLIGFGAIGREVAKRLRGWGCHISYYDTNRPDAATERALQVDYLSLDELLHRCDIISLHVPVLPETRGMINADTLRQMKPTALLINTARGEIVDQGALYDALASGELYGACLDTLSPEPAPMDLKLLHLPPEHRWRLIVTPHIGGTTDEAFTRMLRGAIANMQRMEQGEPLINVVNS